MFAAGSITRSTKSAVEFWALLSEGATVTTVVERLTGEFDVPPDQLSRDVEGFVAHLRRSKLLAS